MSFFIKGKRSSVNTKFTKSDVKRRKLTNRREENEEEEVTSSSEDELSKTNENVDVESSDNENETAQEKKLRLAKIYLEEIERRERRKLENQDEQKLNGSSVAQILKDDYLKASGKFQITLANKYTGADTKNIKILKCKEHRSTITCLCLTNKHIFSGSKNGSIIKWSIDECKKISSIPYAKQHVISNKVTGHMNMITSLAITTDEKFMAVSDSSNNIQIWDPSTLKHIQTLKGHTNTVTGLAFRRNTHTLYSCGKDKAVKVWSLDEMAYVETLYGHQNAITSIDALTRERVITAGGMDGTIRVWKIVEESQLIYNGPSASIDIVRLVNEEMFVSGSDDGALNVWGVNKKKPVCIYKNAHGCNPINNEPYWICSIATLINTDLIASGSQDGFIKLWKLSSNFKSIELLFTIEVVGFVNDLVFTDDGKYLIAAIGTEHKNGRWNIIKSAKNSVIKIPLIITK